MADLSNLNDLVKALEARGYNGRPGVLHQGPCHNDCPCAQKWAVEDAKARFMTGEEWASVDKAMVFDPKQIPVAHRGCPYFGCGKPRTEEFDVPVGVEGEWVRGSSCKEHRYEVAVGYARLHMFEVREFVQEVKIEMTDQEMKDLMDRVERMFDDVELAAGRPVVKNIKIDGSVMTADVLLPVPNFIKFDFVVEVKCECGAHAAQGVARGAPGHSGWCPWSKA